MTTRHAHAKDYQHGHPQAAAQMKDAAIKFLGTLKPDQKAKATFSLYDGERIFWYYPPMNRHGLKIKEMDANQRQAAKALMATGLTPDSNQKANAIMDHEAILGPLEKEQGHIAWERDPLLYSWTIFGDPNSAKEPWGWRVEGHHVSLHYTIWGERVVSVTPFFFGANPSEVRKGPKQGLRILGASEDLALELMNSLDAGQKSKALIFDEAPADILTFNASRASLPKEQGLPASRMSGTQKEILMSLCAEYVNRVRSDVSKERLDSVRSNLDNIHLAWGGPAERAKPHYYRLHGGSFVVEFDNRQNGANHIHSVWRDVENDFANDAMRDHLLMYHAI
ncbi:MAG: DUF3500 domain-containing protein [SAR202 cluster bacterium]|nr:DUF3500 domain-containing protein [SAR202 cluster bacterium]